MIIRIVKMQFAPEGRRKFLKLYRSVEKKILQCRGCLRLELLRDAADGNTYYTYSLWKSAGDLHRYRASALFREVWPRAKKLFIANAEAWTLQTPTVKYRQGRIT